MKPKIALLVITVFFNSFLLFSQNTYVPDDNFEQVLINLGYDSGILDDSVSTLVIASIRVLDISNKQIADLTGIEDFTSLEQLFCNNNNLSSLQLSANDSLITLNCAVNNLSELDVSLNPLLRSLVCNQNTLTELNLSHNSSLRYLSCQSNQLSSLNIRNGNNSAMVFFDATQNSNLLCIEVDNIEEAYNNTLWKKDVNTGYSEDCSDYKMEMTYVPDDNFEQALIYRGYDVGPLNDSVPTQNIKRLKTLYLYNNEIANLTGIEDFQELVHLICSGGKITELDLSLNEKLEEISCDNNNISILYLPLNSNITALNCSGNNLSNLSLTGSESLKFLHCSNNLLVDLDLRDFSELTYLDCRNNNLSGLNIQNGNNVDLELDARNNTHLFCIEVDDFSSAFTYQNWYKPVYAIYSSDCNSYVPPMSYIPDDNFEQFLIGIGYDFGPLNDSVPSFGIEKLKNLNISNKNISDLIGIEDFLNLEQLNCDNNTIESFDLSMNRKLQVLNCSRNQIKNLNLSSNSNLTSLICTNNDLTSLNLRNGNNSNLILDARYNNNLFCIEVDDISITNNNSSWQKNSYAVFNEDCSNYKIKLYPLPDDNFEQALIDLDYDFKPLDDSVPAVSIEAITSLDIDHKNISDLEGIEYFKSLESLECDGNNLTQLDVSSNINLRFLSCAANKIEQLNTTANQKLEKLFCFRNNLTDLDLSRNISLNEVDCATNLITSLNLKNGNNELIEWAIIDDNPLLFCIEVDSPEITYDKEENWVKDKYAAYTNDCSTYEVKMTYVPDDEFEQELIDRGFDPGPINDSIPTHGISRAKELIIEYNYLLFDATGIEDFVSLERLEFHKCRIVSLDLRNLTSLTYLNCFNNVLSSLDLRNGNNHNMWMYSKYNKGLACINVDDPIAAENNPDWTKDDFAIYSSDCSSEDMEMTYIPDDNFETWLYDWGYKDGPLNDSIATSIIEQITEINIASNDIKDLTGIEDFISLTKLSCYSNQIDSLDLSSNMNLTFLNCSGNPLSFLNIGSNVSLTELHCNSTQLPHIEPKLNPELVKLSCVNSAFNTLDLSSNPNLQYVDCSNGQLSALNIRNGHNESLLVLKAKENPNLTCIQVDDIASIPSRWEADATYSEDCQYGCLYSVSDTSLNYTYQSLTDSIFISTSSDCVWDAEIYCDWIKLIYEETNTGEGYLIFSLEENLTSDERVCEILAGGNIIKLKQEPILCEYSLSTNAKTYSSEVTTDSFFVYTNPDCKWSVTNSCDWITVLSGDTGTGNETVLYLIEENNTASERNCEILVADKKMSFIQYNKVSSKTFIPDDNFEQALIDMGYDSEVLDNYVSTDNIDTIKHLFINNYNIADLRGLEDFAALQSLDVSNNMLDFSDIQPIFQYSNYSNFKNNFTYSPQSQLGNESELIKNEGEDLTLFISGYTPATDDEIQWYLDDILVADKTASYLVLTNLQLSDSGRYIAKISNPSAPELILESSSQRVIINKQLSFGVAQNEYQELINIYNATSGTEWINNLNWMDTVNYAVSDWQGVTVENGHITALNLSGMNLNGDITPLFSELDHLRWLDISDNNLTGSFSGAFDNKSGVIESVISGDLSLEYLNIGNNRFTFADLEPAINELNTIEEFIYSPQSLIGQETDTSIYKTESIIFQPLNYVSGMNDIYTWYKDGFKIESASSLEYTIKAATLKDSGAYQLFVSNQLFPDLELASHKNHLTIMNAVGINESQQGQIKIYPNPAQKRIYIDTNNELVNLKILTLSGALLLEKNNINSSWLDIESFTSGIYIFKFIKDDLDVEIRKVILE